MKSVNESRERIVKSLEMLSTYDERDHECHVNLYRIDYMKTFMNWLIIIGMIVLISQYHSSTELGLLLQIFGTIAIGVAVIIIIRKGLENNKTEFYKIQAELKTIRKTCSNRNGIPFQYCKPVILKRFLYYIDNLLAHSLEDCVKVYLEKKNTEQILASQEAIRKNQESIIKSNEKIASKLADKY